MKPIDKPKAATNSTNLYFVPIRAIRGVFQLQYLQDILSTWVMKEIIFEVTEDNIDGGYTASALGYGIHTEADTLLELRESIREAVACYFDESMEPVGSFRTKIK